MKLFGKKKETEACSCGGNCAGNVDGKAESVKENGIKILGSGCAKCNALEKAVRCAVAELGLADDISHVTDYTEIAGYGVMSTPALVYHGRVLSYGKVLTVEEAKELLSAEKNKK